MFTKIDEFRAFPESSEIKDYLSYQLQDKAIHCGLSWLLERYLNKKSHPNTKGEGNPGHLLGRGGMTNWDIKMMQK